MKEDTSIEKFKLLGNFVKELADMSQQFVDLKSSELQNRMALSVTAMYFRTFRKGFLSKTGTRITFCATTSTPGTCGFRRKILPGSGILISSRKSTRKKPRHWKTRSSNPEKAGENEETLWLGGQEIIAQIVRVPLKGEEGHAAGILGVLWEVTEKRRAEEEAKKYQTHLEELVFARTSELERVSAQFQGETASRRRIEEESRSAAEEWNRLRASLQGQVTERLAEIQRPGEQFQQEFSLRRRAEDELQRTREEWQRIRADLEGQLSTQGNELQGLQEKFRREEDENRRLAGEYQGAMEEFKKIRSDLENQLAEQAAQLHKIGEQWQHETADRKRLEEEYRLVSEEFRRRHSEFEVQLTDGRRPTAPGAAAAGDECPPPA